MRPLSPVPRPEGRVWSTCRVGGSKLLESRILDGFVVALFVVSMWHQVAASLGGSLATDVAVGWGLAIGAGLGLAGRGRRGWLLLGLAVWSAVLGGLLSEIVLGLSLIPIDQLVTVDGLPVAMLVTTSALSLPLAWSVRLGWLAACRSSRQLRSFLLGTAIGAVMAAHLLFGWIGVDATVLLAAVVAGLLFLFTFFRFSVEVSSLKDHNIVLAQKLGLLEWEVKSQASKITRLEKKNKAGKRKASSGDQA